MIMLHNFFERFFDKSRPNATQQKSLKKLTSEGLQESLAQGNRDFREVNLRGENLRGLDLQQTTFIDSDLSDCDFTGACLIGINLSGSSLARINGAGIQLVGANLLGVNLRGSNLSHAILRGVNLTDADLRDTNLNWADLQGAALNGVLYTPNSLTWANLDGTGIVSKVPKTARLPMVGFRGLKRRTVRPVAFKASPVQQSDSGDANSPKTSA